MALFTVKTSNKIDTSMRLEESTAKMLDRYAHFHKASADDVVNEALEYIFKHDKDFQQDLTVHPDAKVNSTVRVKVPAMPKAAKKKAADTSTITAATAK